MKTSFWTIFFAVWLGGVAAIATVNTIGSLYRASEAKKEAHAAIISNADRQITATRELLAMFDRGEIGDTTSLTTAAESLRLQAKAGAEILPKETADAMLALGTEIDEAVKSRKSKR